MKRRIITTILATLMLITAFVVSVSAARSGMYFVTSRDATTKNYSAADAPALCNSITQYESLYLDFAATSDYFFGALRFLIVEPGSNTYKLIYSEKVPGYLRWEAYRYQFTKVGTYKVRVEVDSKYSNTHYCSERIVYVRERTGNTYTYNGNTYTVVPNFKTDYCFNQKDFPRFLNSKGTKNVGCTATAMCIVYSIAHNTTLSPNNVKWTPGVGTSWEYSKRYSDGNRTYTGNCYTQKDGLKAVYNCISAGKPIVIGVTGVGDHVVAGVGVRNGADPNNLSLSDILIVDPYGGDICTLAKYTGIDTEWALRVSI